MLVYLNPHSNGHTTSIAPHLVRFVQFSGVGPRYIDGTTVGDQVVRPGIVAFVFRQPSQKHPHQKMYAL